MRNSARYFYDRGLVERLRDWFALLRFRIVARRLPRTGPYAPGVISEDPWDYTLDAHVSPEMLHDRSETDPSVQLLIPRPYGPDERGRFRHSVRQKGWQHPNIYRNDLTRALSRLGFDWKRDGVTVGQKDD